MALGYRGYGLLISFLIVDAALIWIVNTSQVDSVAGAPAATGEQVLVNAALLGAAVIAILAAIFFRFKPVPANLRGR